MGSRRGDEVVQVYHRVGDAIRARIGTAHAVPRKRLVAFERVGVTAGATQQVIICTYIYSTKYTVLFETTRLFQRTPRLWINHVFLILSYLILSYFILSYQLTLSIDARRCAVTNADGDYELHAGQHSLLVETGVGGATPLQLTFTVAKAQKWTNLHQV